MGAAVFWFRVAVWRCGQSVGRRRYEEELRFPGGLGLAHQVGRLAFPHHGTGRVSHALGDLTQDPRVARSRAAALEGYREEPRF